MTIERFTAILVVNVDIPNHVPDEELGIDKLQEKHKLNELVKEAVREGNFSYEEVERVEVIEK